MPEANQQESLWPMPEEELREMRKRAAAEREIELEVRRRMGQNVDSDNVAFIDHLMNFPKVDVPDWIFDRHMEEGAPDVPR